MNKPVSKWIVAAGLAALLAAATANADAPPSLVSSVEAWRKQRIASLTSENGWLTLVALLPMKAGSNSFGRAATNSMRVDHVAMPARAGVFTVRNGVVALNAASHSGITAAGKPVSQLQLSSDASETPTVLSLGSLRFFVIERAGKLFLRVRDVQNPRRTQFKGIESFAIAGDWNISARFEPYTPARDITIVNILGLEQKMPSPGAIVFEKDGRSWRLDAIDEDPQADELFVMFADGTTGRETYGAGRFLYVPRPKDGSVDVDFNRSVNPPCAFNDFATCPLPPPQNKITLRVEAGEKKYHR